MKKFTQIMLVGLVLGLGSGVLGLVGSKPAPAQFPPPTVPVRVTNTPLPVTGTVNANVSGTVPVIGSVNVTNTPLPVSGTISAIVSGTPTVNLGAGTSVGINGPISVGNTATSPVLVSDVDNPAHDPVIGGCDNTGGNPCTLLFITQSNQFLNAVPAGYELVIDMVSGNINVPSGTVPAVSLNTNSNPTTLIPVKVGTLASTDYYVFSEATRIFAPPTSPVTFSFAGGPAGVNVQGHLVQCGPSAIVAVCPPL